MTISPHCRVFAASFMKKVMYQLDHKLETERGARGIVGVPVLNA